MKTHIMKLLVISTLMIFFGAGVSLADDRGGGNGKSRQHNGQKYRGDDDGPKHHGRDDYQRYRGYRPKPIHHHHHHYQEHFHHYNYNGHWTSWESWEYYKKRNPSYARHGRYERYNNQLFFLFNDGVNAFMFSIGR